VNPCLPAGWSVFPLRPIWLKKKPRKIPGLEDVGRRKSEVGRMDSWKIGKMEDS